MNSKQRQLSAQINALLREAAHHRYAFEIHSQLKCCCSSLLAVHQRQLETLRAKVQCLLLDLMNSGLSHRRFLKLLKAWGG